MDNFYRPSKKRLFPKHFISAMICNVVVALVLTGCGPSILHDATYHRYMEQGDQARNASNYIGAEVAYQRALANVQLGNLGSKKKAAALHLIGRTKRLLGQYEEAEEYLLSSLALIEEVYRDDEANSFEIGYVLLDLAWCYFDQNKIDEGVDILSRMESLYLKYSDHYPKKYRIYMKDIFVAYATELDKQGRTTEAHHFQFVANQIIIPEE